VRVLRADPEIVTDVLRYGVTAQLGECDGALTTLWSVDHPPISA